jgi:hypothetical protein
MEPSADGDLRRPRGTDRTKLPDELVARYDSGVTDNAVPVFQPE